MKNFSITLKLTALALAAFLAGCAYGAAPSGNNGGDQASSAASLAPAVTMDATRYEGLTLPRNFTFTTEVSNAKPVHGTLVIDSTDSYDLDTADNFAAVQVADLADGGHSFDVNLVTDGGKTLTASGTFSVSTNLPVLINASLPAVVHTNVTGFTMTGDFESVSAMDFYKVIRSGLDRSTVTSPASLNFTDSSLLSRLYFYNLILADTGGHTNTNQYFLVRTDFVKPAVSTFSISNLASSVSLVGPYSVTFSEPMDTNGAETLIRLYKLGNPLATTLSWSADRKSAALTPVVPLESGATFTLVVSNQTRDRAGNTLVSNHSVTFSSLFPPLSTAPVFADKQLLVVRYPTNGTTNFSALPSKFQWNLPYAYGSNSDTYRYYFLLMVAPPEVNGNEIMNPYDAVKYWASDLGQGVVGNIDVIRDTYDIVNGAVKTTSDYSFTNGQVYYMMVYSVNRYYQVKYSSPVILVRW